MLDFLFEPHACISSQDAGYCNICTNKIPSFEIYTYFYPDNSDTRKTMQICKNCLNKMNDVYKQLKEKLKNT